MTKVGNTVVAEDAAPVTPEFDAAQAKAIDNSPTDIHLLCCTSTGKRYGRVDYCCTSQRARKSMLCQHKSRLLSIDDRLQSAFPQNKVCG